jgi:hypothetical protein
MTALLLAFALLGAAPDQPQQPAAPQAAQAPSAPKFSTKTPLSTLMANAQAREILRKHLPDVIQFLEGAGASQASDEFTVESLAAIPRAGVTPEKLQAMNQDLAKL